MALNLLASNNATTVLAGSISATATTLTVNSGTGNIFPTPVAGTSYFKLTLIDAATGTLTEIVHVTSRSGDVFTIQRAQEGTTSRIWSANDIVANMMTAGTLSYIMTNFAPLANPALTGSPTTPTATAVTNNTQIASTAFVHAASAGVIGSSRNARMVVTAASSSSTFSANEITVGSSIGGAQFRIGNVNSAINISGTGAGGMDTGSPPATGYVAVYVIYNPTNGSVALLGVDATSTLAPEVYGGSNMPTGYTASALIAVWPTASGQFVIGNMYGRKVDVESRVIITSTSISAGRAPLTTTQFPLNARFIYGGLSMTNAAASTMGLTIWGANGSVGGMALTASVMAGGSASSVFSKVSVTGQTTGWSSTSTEGTPTYGIGLGAYEF